MYKSVKNFLRYTWVKVVVLFLVVIFVLFLILRENSSDSKQIHVVEEQTVEQVVLLSGSVKAVDQVNLSFGAIGKVTKVNVSQGDEVEEGQILAELDYSIVNADLLQAQGKVKSAKANVSLAEASVEKAQANLAYMQAVNRGTNSSISSAETILRNTINEQAVLVQNAYSNLLNNDLVAYPIDSYKNLPAPVVSGNYMGEEAGEYVLDFYNSVGIIRYSVRVSGLENDTVSFDFYGIPSPLGSQGLYLTFPESGEDEIYGYTDWIVPVPNVRSNTYQTMLGAYKKALQTESMAVSKAQANLDSLIAQQESEGDIAITTAQEQQARATLEEAKANLEQSLGSLVQAQSGVAKIEAQIENHIVRAPFIGTIARLDYVVGESIPIGQTGITLITNGDYELIMNIPEIAIGKVSVGDTAEIILDAYKADEVWEGFLTEIELVETEIDGVPSYSSIVTITEPDERIKTGMNARARIVVDEKPNVIAIPVSYIIKDNDSSKVLLKKSENEIVEQVVYTGLQGTDFFIEVIEGLTVGDIIVLPSDR